MKQFSKRVRILGPKYSSLSGCVFSPKNNVQIQFESSLERDFIYLQEFDSDVVAYMDQPLKIKYMNLQFEKRSYTPDFLVYYTDSSRKPDLIEIKYSQDIIKNHFIFAPKFKAARDFCDINNLNFRIVTEKDIRFLDSVYLKNTKFILSYRDVFENTTSKEVLDKISDITYFLLNELDNSGPISIQVLLDIISLSYPNRKENLFFIWFLIAKKYIMCDLNVELNLNSIIWKL